MTIDWWTMALQTIGPRDVGLMQKGGYKGTDFSLTTHDIRGKYLSYM